MKKIFLTLLLFGFIVNIQSQSSIENFSEKLVASINNRDVISFRELFITKNVIDDMVNSTNDKKKWREYFFDEYDDIDGYINSLYRNLIKVFPVNIKIIKIDYEIENDYPFKFTELIIYVLNNGKEDEISVEYCVFFNNRWYSLNEID